MQTHKIPNLRPRPPPFKIAHGPVAMGSVHREILVYACGVDHGAGKLQYYFRIASVPPVPVPVAAFVRLSAIRALPSFPGFPAHIHRERERERESELNLGARAREFRAPRAVRPPDRL